MRDTPGIPAAGRNTPATISFMEVSIPRWISSAADGTLNMTVGSLLPVAPPNHLAAVHVTSVGRSTTQAKRLPTAATGAGRFMLTYAENLPADPKDSAPVARHNAAVNAATKMEAGRQAWTEGCLPSRDATEVTCTRAPM